MVVKISRYGPPLPRANCKGVCAEKQLEPWPDPLTRQDNGSVVAKFSTLATTFSGRKWCICYWLPSYRLSWNSLKYLQQLANRWAIDDKGNPQFFLLRSPMYGKEKYFGCLFNRANREELYFGKIRKHCYLKYNNKGMLLKADGALVICPEDFHVLWDPCGPKEVAWGQTASQGGKNVTYMGSYNWAFKIKQWAALGHRHRRGSNTIKPT
uniref:Uncharacterized protein n=1 Tax=Oryza meridionalis TaxID=40149 RepID=A0A0E0EPP6_9ORYZ